MEWHVLGHVEDTYSDEEHVDNPVKLIRFGAAHAATETPSGDEVAVIRNVYTEFDYNPLPMLRTSMEQLPSYVDVIVGHSMVSASAALRLREQFYPNSKVLVLF